MDILRRRTDILQRRTDTILKREEKQRVNSYQLCA
jgi:hypothetical protein